MSNRFLLVPLLLLMTVLAAGPVSAGQIFPPEGNCTDGDVLIYKTDHIECDSGLVPTGTIAAFALGTCPTGWTAATSLAGRTIVGAGQGYGLTYRWVGAAGGEEYHTLTIAEMPWHTHSYGSYSNSYGWFSGWGDYPAAGDRWQTQGAGGNQAHNTMMPFLVLLFCQKN